MMKETNYKKSLLSITRGLAGIMVSIWHTVYNYPARTMLVISMLCNVWLFVAMANARVERDQYNHQNIKAEQTIDSLQVFIKNN